LLICDVQTKFQPLIYRSASVINRCSLLNNVATALNMPVIVTEQYPKAFGSTVPELVLNADTKVFAKRKFSMLTDEAHAHLQSLDPLHIILCGVETHVCVQQTALDLLQYPQYDVHIVGDAVSSQRSYDRTVALDRMKSAGAVLTSAESLIFELMKDSEHPQFKTVSQLVKASNMLDNEFGADTTL
jgi:nicotinamidase-related amidase